MTRTRSGELKKPLCPHCGKPLRVKPVSRTVAMQLWQCKPCIEKGEPANEREWTNAGLLLILEDANDRQA